MIQIVFISIIFVAFVNAQSTAQTVMPVIGVLGLPIDQSCDSLANAHINRRLAKKNTTSCFASFYPKWIEAAGGRVIPLRFDLTKNQIDEVFSKLNGVLFTGGGLDLTLNSKYVETASRFLELAIAAGDFPLWGTCQGFQLLNILVAGTQSVLKNGFDSEHLSLPLNFTAHAPSSSLYGSLSKQNYETLAKKSVTVNLHHEGVEPQTFINNAKLSSFYNMLSTNADRKGRQFVSSMEAKQYPIFGVQYHPERNLFEHAPTYNINHDLEAKQVMQSIANNFIKQAQKNNHSFDPKTLDSLVIENYNSVYTGIHQYSYYFF